MVENDPDDPTDDPTDDALIYNTYTYTTHAFPTDSRFRIQSEGPTLFNAGVPGDSDRALTIGTHRQSDESTLQFVTELTGGDAKSLRLAFDVEAWESDRRKDDPGEAAFIVVLDVDSGNGFEQVLDFGKVTTRATLVPAEGDYVNGTTRNGADSTRGLMMDQLNSDHKDVVHISEVDRHVLMLIREGDCDTWNDFVMSYYNRLFSFALRQVDQSATAEDIVQDTFVSFLKMLDRYRHDCDIETFLFQILRRRIVDYYRAKGKRVAIRACGTIQESGHDRSQFMGMEPASDPAYDLEQYETRKENENTLAQAIRILCGRLRKKKKFRDLKIAEGTLYASLSNLVIAKKIRCSPNEVAVVKHRLIGRLSDSVQELSPDWNGDPMTLPEEMLATVWDRLRPSCPKRTTLGKYLLILLPEDWHSYVNFHAKQIGCQYCLANLDELSAVNVDESRTVPDRIFQSTVGFLGDSAFE